MNFPNPGAGRTWYPDRPQRPEEDEEDRKRYRIMQHHHPNSLGFDRRRNRGNVTNFSTGGQWKSETMREWETFLYSIELYTREKLTKATFREEKW